MKVTWSTLSGNDLRAIRDYIARDSDHYARLQVERIIQRIERAASMPMSGHPVMNSRIPTFGRCTKETIESSTKSNRPNCVW